MSDHDLSYWTHAHRFHTGKPVAERRTRWVLALTLLTMVVEILAGMVFNSMALLADGWHMSSHALAVGLSVAAYALARRWAGDGRFAFGTWKLEVLGAYSSALLLLGIALSMAWASVERLLAPGPIQYREAIFVAVLGLVVNVVCALLLDDAGHDHGHRHGDNHDHGNGHSHGHEHDSHGQDLNLRAAYVHVLTDAVTSVLAIVALLGGWHFGWAWLDPAMGLVGALLVALWARGLIVQSGAVLLDREMDHPLVARIRAGVETSPDAGATRVADLHLWRVGQNAFACALSLVTHDRTLTPAAVRLRLADQRELVHVTVEIQRCCTDE